MPLKDFLRSLTADVRTQPPRPGRRFILGALTGATAVLSGATVAQASEEAGDQRSEKVVYHLDSLENGTALMRHLAKHLQSRPAASLEVVAVSSGVRVLVSGTENSNGNDYESLINDLQRRGVVFKACGNTMETLKLSQEDLVWDVVIVEAGMAELGRLQAQEGCAYIKV